MKIWLPLAVAVLTGAAPVLAHDLDKAVAKSPP